MAHFSSKILGAPSLTEAWAEKDIINMIIGSCGTDSDKWRKALGILKKGMLKKIYVASGGDAETVKPEAGDDEGIEDVSGDEGGVTDVSLSGDEASTEDEETVKA